MPGLSLHQGFSKNQPEPFYQFSFVSFVFVCRLPLETLMKSKHWHWLIAARRMNHHVIALHSLVSSSAGAKSSRALNKYIALLKSTAIQTCTECTSRENVVKTTKLQFRSLRPPFRFDGLCATRADGYSDVRCQTSVCIPFPENHWLTQTVDTAQTQHIDGTGTGMDTLRRHIETHCAR